MKSKGAAFFTKRKKQILIKEKNNENKKHGTFPFYDANNGNETSNSKQMKNRWTVYSLQPRRASKLRKY